MKYIPLKFIKEDPSVGNADSSEDAKVSTELLERLVADIRRQLEDLSPRAESLRRADLLLQLSRALVRLEKKPEAWATARTAFELYLAEAAWEGDLRAEQPQRDQLLIYTNQVLATVARRHSDIEGQQAFDRWLVEMELNDPALFLPRLRNVVDVLVQDDWWFDREALQAKLPA